MDSNDFKGMREEFGDLLLQIMLNSQIASEEGEFTVNDVIRDIYRKIVRRHPHVFGDFKVAGVDGVLANWEKLKERERSESDEEKGLLDGVPLALPALSQAQDYQDRAARVGFDWPEIEGVLDKIAEEIGEVKEATDDRQLVDELGDLFFALVNLARWKKVDAESALRGANLKFKRRFGYIERGAKKQTRNLSDLSLDEMEISVAGGQRPRVVAWVSAFPCAIAMECALALRAVPPVLAAGPGAQARNNPMFPPAAQTRLRGPRLAHAVCKPHGSPIQAPAGYRTAANCLPSKNDRAEWSVAPEIVL